MYYIWLACFTDYNLSFFLSNILLVKLKLSVNIYKCRCKCLEQSLHLLVDNQRLNRFLKYKCLCDFKEKLVTRHIY